jgi:hypothetical protein
MSMTVGLTNIRSVAGPGNYPYMKSNDSTGPTGITTST